MNYKLPEDMRSELQAPFGKLLRDDKILELVKGKNFVVVGDASVYFMLKNKRNPNMAVTDGKIKRKGISKEIKSVLDSWAVDSYEVNNPPATITEELQEIVKEHINNGHVHIKVKGEEDLAVIPCISYSAPGTFVIYGQPNESMVAVEVNNAIKKKVQGMLKRMEVF
jgi:uncharacterized protein (UPF0218 family)